MDGPNLKGGRLPSPHLQRGVTAFPGAKRNSDTYWKVWSFTGESLGEPSVCRMRPMLGAGAVIRSKTFQKGPSVQEHSLSGEEERVLGRPRWAQGQPCHRCCLPEGALRRLAFIQSLCKCLRLGKHNCISHYLTNKKGKIRTCLLNAKKS